ncbi:hypothetical protein KIH79_06680 [Bifidobacterium sp. 82T10]|uniref:Uncharacterized protein n=1 Tax=Bifidobacterium miconis TaxID=2834435 RepID=A0ABS6WFX4_9BIFI|nr:hypothetical protein [Bifidobacterium miconis]MBW3092635.1 hypothetical protein [Bifidobacterium miconis]
MTKIVNMSQDPACLSNHSVYQGKATQQPNGLWKYEQKDETITWSTFMGLSNPARQLLASTPLVVYLEFEKSDAARIDIYNGGTQILNETTRCAFLVETKWATAKDGPVLSLGGPAATAWVIPHAHAEFTQADWQAWQAGHWPVPDSTEQRLFL